MISYMSTHWYHILYHRLRPSSIHTKYKTSPCPHTSIDKQLSITEIYIKTSNNKKIIKNQLQNVIMIDMGSKQYLHWYHKHWYHKIGINDIIDCLFILNWQPQTLPVRCAASSSQLPWSCSRWHTHSWFFQPPRWTPPGGDPCWSATSNLKCSPRRVCCRCSYLAVCQLRRSQDADRP